MNNKLPFIESDALKDNAAPQGRLNKLVLPCASMQHFQDEAHWFFRQYTNPAVGYVITKPENLLPLRPYTSAASAACIVVRDEAAFDKAASIWKAPFICNSSSLDLTECMTCITFDQPTPEKVSDDIICIPDQFIDPVITDSMITGHLAVVLCSLTRAMLFIFPFDDADIDCLQASGGSAYSNWRPYAIYDKQTMAAAAKKYGHLSKGASEGWGREITSFFTEETAVRHREEMESAAD